MRASRLHLAFKNIKRLRAIIAIFVRHGFQPLMERLHLMGLVSLPQRILGRKTARAEEELTEPMRLRLAMEELGPTFIKFGQILSTRPDIVPEEFVSELLKLQDRVPPVPFDTVMSVIEGEFKRPVKEIFTSIDREPIAAASIAQVHRAVTASGEEVVIKVQRPGIERVIQTDISILGYMARLMLKYVPESELYNPPGMVDEFSMVINKELDFTLEASYTERFRKNFSGDSRVKIPKVFWDLSGKKVLTMERVRGIKIDRVERLKEHGIDTRRVADLLADVFFKQVFEHGLFHGDLHSGNIFVLSEEKLAFVDFGIVGRIDAKMKQNLADILIGFVKEDATALTKVYVRMGILPESIDRASFEREYYDIIQHYFARPLSHVKIGELMMDYASMAARHRIKLPRELLLFDKCLIELEGLAKVLFPEVNLLKEAEPYAEKLFYERMRPGAVAAEIAGAAGDYRDLLRDLPVDASQILKKVKDDKLSIEFFHKGLDDFMGTVDRSSSRLASGIIVAALVVGSSLVLSSGMAPTILGIPMLGIIGLAAASIIGLWLVVQTIRSGRF